MRLAIGILTALLFTACTSNEKLKDTSMNARNIVLRDSIFLAQHFDTSHTYSKPICLLYKQKPLLTIGNRISELPNDFSYRFDPIVEFQEFYGIITDYLSLTEHYTIEQTTGSVNGILFFAADAHSNRIFSVSGNWLFDIDTTRIATTHALDALRDKLLPCLPSSTILLKQRSFKIDNGDFTESFALIAPKEDSSAFHLYSLQYKASLNPR